MISARLRRRSAVEGVLVPVPRALTFDGAEREGGALVFSDLVAFARTVAQLRKDGALSDWPPYLDFLAATPPPRDAEFDWSSVPASTRYDVMPHQDEAIREVLQKHNGRALVALEPGVGKTYIGCLLAHHYGPHALIVCPASTVLNWLREFKLWTGRDATKLKPKMSVVPLRLVASITSLVRNPVLLNERWDVVVVDESHMLKNDCARTLSMVATLARTAALVLLSGTPQENRPCELFNQLRMLHPHVFSSREAYTSRYSDGHVNERGVWEERGARQLEELHVLMDRCMFRRTGITVVDYPLERHQVRFGVDGPDRQLLDAQRAQQRELASEEARAPDARLKNVVARKRDLHINLMRTTVGRVKSRVALDWLGRLAEKHKDEKIVVFVHYHEALEPVAAYLATLGETAVVSGSTTLPKRDALISAFRHLTTGPRFGVFTIDAVGVGINLTPGVSVVVMLELDKSPGKMGQAEKRAYRKKAARRVASYWCTLDDSYDQDMVRDMQARHAVNGAVLDAKKKQQFLFDSCIRA